MTAGRPSIGITPSRVWRHAGALLTLLLLACSSSDPRAETGDRRSVAPDAGDTRGSGEDAGADRGDAGEGVPPPPYNFAVNCGDDPCVTQIAARGGAHACAVLRDGSVQCWGSNASGQLGTGPNDDGSPPGYEATPRRVFGISGATFVAATGEKTSGTTCALSGAGSVACFGSDVWGQLGRPSGASKGPNPEPTDVVGIRAKSLTLTNTFVVAIGTDDRLWSWGANDSQQLARDTSGPDAGSATTAASAGRVSSPVRSCAGTSSTGFAVTEGGSLLSWGGRASEQLGRTTSLGRDPIPAAIAISDVANVVAGAAHACALSRGRVHCWGTNEHGQLGTGRKAEELLPAAVALPAGVYAVAVAAGANNSCIIAANGDVYCWGANGSGQVGTSSGLDQAMPVRIGLEEEAVGIAVMDDAICGLLRGGSVACWGDNLVGQLGRGGIDLDLHPDPGLVVFK
jgi:alpha-tubulin suppressor-like RCC1 family protein